MPSKDNKTQIETIKRNLRMLSRQSEITLSYVSLLYDVQQILALPDTNRDIVLKNYFLDLSTRIANSVADIQANILSIESRGNKYENHPALGTNSDSVFKNTASCLRQLVSIVNPDYQIANPTFGATPEEVHEAGLNIIKNRTYTTETPKYLKYWDRKCYQEEAADFKKNITTSVGYRFPGKIQKNDSKAHYIADVYNKTLIIQDELSKHGFVWRIFNFLKVAAYKEYINTANEMFEKVGFSPEQHGADAVQFLQTTVMPPFDRDIDILANAYQAEINDNKLKNIKEITTARDKLAKAQALEKNPETALYSKVAHIYEKHGLQMDHVEIGDAAHALIEYSKKYDTLRDTESLMEFPKTAFFFAFKSMYTSALEQGKEINISEMLVDAHNIAIIATEHYTPLFQLEETKEEISKLAFGGFTSDNIKNRIQYFSREFNLSPEKLTGFQNSAVDTIENFFQSPEKVAEYNTKLIEPFLEKEVIQEETDLEIENEKKQDIIKKDENEPEREPFPVDLNENLPTDTSPQVISSVNPLQKSITN